MSSCGAMARVWDPAKKIASPPPPPPLKAVAVHWDDTILRSHISVGLSLRWGRQSLVGGALAPCGAGHGGIACDGGPLPKALVTPWVDAIIV